MAKLSLPERNHVVFKDLPGSVLEWLVKQVCLTVPSLSRPRRTHSFLSLCRFLWLPRSAASWPWWSSPTFPSSLLYNACWRAIDSCSNSCSSSPTLLRMSQASFLEAERLCLQAICAPPLEGAYLRRANRRCSREDGRQVCWRTCPKRPQRTCCLALTRLASCACVRRTRLHSAMSSNRFLVCCPPPSPPPPRDLAH